MIDKYLGMKKKILVLDDELTITMLLDNFLSVDFEMACFNESREALTWLEANIPDLIICDIQMPEVDGYDVLKMIRQRGFTAHTPVVMLSAKTESSERIKCYKLGAQDYLTKPFNPEELEQVVKKNIFPIYYSIVW